MAEKKVVVVVDDNLINKAFFVEAISKTWPAAVVCTQDDCMDILYTLTANKQNYPAIILMDMSMTDVGFFSELRTDHLFSAIPLVLYSTAPSEAEIKNRLAPGESNDETKQSAYCQLCTELNILVLKQLADDNQ